MPKIDMKHIEALAALSSGKAPAQAPSGGTEILKQFNSTLTNLKDVILMINQTRGTAQNSLSQIMQSSQGPALPDPQPSKAPAPGGDLALKVVLGVLVQALSSIEAAGHGAMPIGKAIAQIKTPVSDVNQMLKDLMARL